MKTIEIPFNLGDEVLFLNEDGIKIGIVSNIRISKQDITYIVESQCGIGHTRSFIRDATHLFKTKQELLNSL